MGNQMCLINTIYRLRSKTLIYINASTATLCFFVKLNAAWSKVEPRPDSEFVTLVKNTFGSRKILAQRRTNMNSLTLTSISGNRWMKLTAMFLAFSLSFSQIPLSFAAEPIGPNNEINAPTPQATTAQSDPGPQAPPEPTAQFMEGNAL